MLLANREWHALGQRQDHPLGLIQYEDVMDITNGYHYWSTMYLF